MITCQWSPPPVKSCVSTVDPGSAFTRVCLISSGLIMTKFYRLKDALSSTKILLSPGLRIKVGTDFFHHLPQVFAQLVQRRPTDIPVTTVKIMHGQIRHQAKSIRDGRDAASLRGFGHIQLLHDFAILIAEKREICA